MTEILPLVINPLDPDYGVRSLHRERDAGMAIAARLGARVPRPNQINIAGFEIEPSDVVVDVGSGDGTVSRYAGQRGAEVISLDIESLCIERTEAAMQGVPARSWRGIVSDCDPIPLPSGVASVVVCTEVLEHVPDPAKFAAELARIGRPGARYAISVPDPTSEGLMRMVAPAWYWEPPFHVRVFEHAELDALLASAGLIVETRQTCGSLDTIWWLLRMSLGAEPYAPPIESRMLRSWEDVYATLGTYPNGTAIVRALDRVLPKSQVVVARKRGAPLAALRRRFLSPTRWKSRIRRGSISLAGYELGWTLRRTRPPRIGPPEPFPAHGPDSSPCLGLATLPDDPAERPTP